MYFIDTPAGTLSLAILKHLASTDGLNTTYGFLIIGI